MSAKRTAVTMQYAPAPSAQVLEDLCIERAKLQRQLSYVLTRVGASHPQRSITNVARAFRRKELRRALRHNADQIAAHCMSTIIIREA